MSKPLFYYLLTMLIFGICSCSPHANTPFRRSWYGLNTHYNIYYNAQRSFREGLKKTDLDNIDKTEDRPFDETIRKCRKAIELYSIRKKPIKKRGWQKDPKQRALQNRTEYNPFLINCWLLMGHSYYYNREYKEAIAVYSYILEQFQENEKACEEAILWKNKSFSFIENKEIITEENHLTQFYPLSYYHVGIAIKQMNLVPEFRKSSVETGKEFYKLLLLSPSDRKTDNELLFDISTFNFNLLYIQLDTEVKWFNKYRIITIGSFSELWQIHLYRQKGYENSTIFGLTDESLLIPISGYNYNLLKNEEDISSYLKFYFSEEIAELPL